MTPAIRALTFVQALSLFGLVAIFIRPRASWSVAARLPVTVIVFVSSAALLLTHIV